MDRRTWPAGVCAVAKSQALGCWLEVIIIMIIILLFIDTVVK